MIGAGWGTVAEKRFIDGLGMHTPVAGDRRELLGRYLETFPLRRDWGSINVEAVEQYARNVMGRLS